MAESPPNEKPVSSTVKKSDTPGRQLIAAIKNRSTAEVSRVLNLDRSLLRHAISTAIYRSDAQLTSYLIDIEKAPIHTIPPVTVATSYVAEPSIDLLNVSVSAGWDINQCDNGGLGRGQRLVELLVHDEELVRWCISRGATIPTDLEGTDPYFHRPMTETVAAVGTVSCFRLIRSLGAPVGRRTLHAAAQSAATCSIVQKDEKMAMVRYLVEEEGLDVKQLDCDEPMPDHQGTVIAYAATGKGGADVVRYLLEKGADPRVKDCYGNWNALEIAERDKNEEVVQVLKEWLQRKKEEYGPEGG